MPAVLVKPSRSYVVTAPAVPERSASILNGCPSHPNPVA